MGTIALILLDRLSAKNTPELLSLLLNIPKSSPVANGGRLPKVTSGR